MPKLKPADSADAALRCGDWLSVIGLKIRSLSTTAEEFWKKNLKVAEETYHKYLRKDAVGRLDIEVDMRGIEEQRWTRLKSAVATMLMEALPEQLVNTEAVAKRSFEVPEILFVVMMAYQPGGSSEKAAVLESLRTIEPHASPTEVLSKLREWRRRTLRAKELSIRR